MVYVPLIVGEADSLRSGAERMLDGSDHGAVNDRIQELNQVVNGLGYKNTFGMEVKFCFVDDPTASEGDDPSYDVLYDEMVGLCGGRQKYHIYKRDIVYPDDETTIDVLAGCRSTYYDVQEQEGMFELATTPGSGGRAVERYWGVIGAIGQVAARHGLMGMIMATHLNTAVLERDALYNGDDMFLNYHHDLVAAQHLAATQYNLVELRCLQMDAGLETGEAVIEAFPASKDCSTAIYKNRQEIRHSLVGVIDPRVDILCSLSALERVATRTVSDEAMSGLISCSTFTDRNRSRMLGPSLDSYCVVDRESGRMAAPMRMDKSSRTDVANLDLDALIRNATMNWNVGYESQDGDFLHNLVSTVRVVGESVVVDEGGEYTGALRNYFYDSTIRQNSSTYRVAPTRVLDMPALHQERRRSIKRSAAARRVFGSAIGSIVSASRSTAYRNSLINRQMISY